MEKRGRSGKALREGTRFCCQTSRVKTTDRTCLIIKAKHRIVRLQYASCWPLAKANITSPPMAYSDVIKKCIKPDLFSASAKNGKISVNHTAVSSRMKVEEEAKTGWVENGSGTISYSTTKMLLRKRARLILYGATAGQELAAGSLWAASPDMAGLFIRTVANWDSTPIREDKKIRIDFDALKVATPWRGTN